MKINAQLVKIVIAGSIASVSCNAPRDNPRDPLSPYYQPPSPPPPVLDLSVDSLTPTRALFSWSSVDRASRWELYYGEPTWDGITLANGVRYQGEMPGVKPGGERISHWVNLPPRMQRKWVLYSLSPEGLRSPPSNPLLITPPPEDQGGSLTAWVNSLYQASWVPPDRIEFQAWAIINDPDGVDSVWLTLENNYLSGLKRDQGTSSWTIQMPEENLPGGNLERLLGHPFQIGYRDLAGFVRRSEPLFVVRIIWSVPEIQFPTNDTLLTNPITLYWEPYYADFEFTFALEVVHVSSSLVYTLWYRREAIPADTTSWRLGVNLPSSPLFYFWTVAVVDEFGNRAVSLPARFRTGG